MPTCPRSISPLCHPGCADLTAKLNFATLINARLAKADLTNADLRDAKLTGALTFTDATPRAVNDGTFWPAGLDPGARRRDPSDRELPRDSPASKRRGRRRSL